MCFSTSAFADCDFSKLIHNQDGSVVYSADCHLKVGQMKADLDSANLQIQDYKKAIELKDLAISKSQERADLWMGETFKLQDRMSTIESYKSKNEVLYFGLGVVFTSLAVFGAGQLARR